MLLMQRNSGLTRLEVNKARLAMNQDVRIQKLHLTLRPACALLLGIAALLVAFQVSLLTVLGFSVAAAALVWGASRQLHAWLAQYDNADTSVLVIREGLVRQGTVADLVPGDTIVLAAGTVLPVDVTGIAAALPKPLAMTLNAFHLVPACAIAGSRVTAAGQAQVVAVGTQRFVLKALVPAMATRPQRSMMVALMIAAAMVKRAFKLGVGRVSLHLARTVRELGDTIRRQFVAAFPLHMTLVGNAKHTAKETAFRYNQDPVSWMQI